MSLEAKYLLVQEYFLKLLVKISSPHLPSTYLSSSRRLKEEFECAKLFHTHRGQSARAGDWGVNTDPKA